MIDSICVGVSLPIVDALDQAWRAWAELRETVRLLAETADPVAFVESATGHGTPQVFPVLR